MKNRFIFKVTISILLLILTGCNNSKNNQVVNPFNDIPINSTKRIEFSTLTITSDEKELGRSKIVTDESDIKIIGEYLKTIECISSNKKEKDTDIQISLIDNVEREKSYIYSIGFSKNQICIYKGTSTSVYKYSDTKVIETLTDMYNVMNYKEEFLYKK